MNPLKKLFISGPKDERLTAAAAPAYKAGFYILMFGILFDLWTRFNYLAQIDAAGNVVQQGPIEWAALLVACAVTSVMLIRSGVYSDSLQFTEARTFGESGAIAPAIGAALLVSIAAVGGRVWNEVAIFGWDQVTWLGDLAMLAVLLVMFIPLFVAVQYLWWKSYRTREDRLAREEER